MREVIGTTVVWGDRTTCVVEENPEEDLGSKSHLVWLEVEGTCGPDCPVFGGSYAACVRWARGYLAQHDAERRRLGALAALALAAAAVDVGAGQYDLSDPDAVARVKEARATAEAEIEDGVIDLLCRRGLPARDPDVRRAREALDTAATSALLRDVKTR